jgi:hypothetical protein
MTAVSISGIRHGFLRLPGVTGQVCKPAGNCRFHSFNLQKSFFHPIRAMVGW